MGALAMGRVVLLPLAAAALLVGGATACGERSEPTGSSAPLYPVTIQIGDRPLVVKHAAKRIAVLDAPTESIVRALGAGRRIVAPAPANRIDFAALKRSRPDLIVAEEDTAQQDLARAASATHANVYTAPGDSIRQVERAITQIGLLLDRPVQARSLIRRIEARKDAVAAKLANVAGVTVFVDTGFFTTVSDQSLIGDLLRLAHGRNVAGASATRAPIEPADLLRLDPAVYLATSDSMLTLADLRRNAKTRKIRAVRNGRFGVVRTDLLEPGPQVGDGLLQVARLLHPNAFR
jgi:ABC-type Fe3+-hydroxamate transport system substrate-binding protein